MNPKAIEAGYELAREAAGSVEYSDWPELQEAIEKFEEAAAISDEPLRAALYSTAHHLWDVLGKEESYPTDDPYTGTDNLLWMMDQVLKNISDMPTDKMSRWIGFVQGVLTVKDVLNVDLERARTRPFFQEAYKAMGIDIPESKNRG